MIRLWNWLMIKDCFCFLPKWPFEVICCCCCCFCFVFCCCFWFWGFFGFFSCTAAQFPCWTATHRRWIKYSVDLGFIISPLILHPYSWETTDLGSKTRWLLVRQYDQEEGPNIFLIFLSSAASASFLNMLVASGMCSVRSCLSVRASGIPY